MKLNFEAPVRLTEALLPLLRATAAKGAPAAIVNVSSTSGRVGRPRAGAYSASKFALAGWSDSLAAEESAHGVHVGLVLPGFVATEGFPATELRRHPVLRWIVDLPGHGGGGDRRLRPARQGRALRPALLLAGGGRAGAGAGHRPPRDVQRDVHDCDRQGRAGLSYITVATTSGVSRT